MGKVIHGLTALLAAVFSVAVVAAQPAKMNLVEQHLQSQGVKIVQSFMSSSGLKAIVADNGSEKRLFYVTADGKNLIAGILFDEFGRNVTERDLQRAGVSGNPDGVKPTSAKPKTPVLSDSQAQGLWDRVEKLRWVQEGTSGKVIYAFFDPNCGYCHSTWGAFRSAVQAGKVQVRWLPVAILAPSSSGLGAALYQAANTGDAMAKLMNRQLAPVTVPDREKRDMALNLLALKDTGYTGTPTLMFKQGNRVVTMMDSLSEKEIAALLQ